MIEEEDRKIYKISIGEFQKRFPEVEGEILDMSVWDFSGEKRYRHVQVRTRV